LRSQQTTVHDKPVTIPETRYAWNGDVALAYQVAGHGPVDLVYFPTFTSNVEWNWAGPSYRRMLLGLASFSRLIVYDRRGWGCSDRLSPGDLPALETHAEDAAMVMEAARSSRAALFAWGDGGVIASLFAATFPDRVSALVLYNCWAAAARTEDTPWRWGDEEAERFIEHRMRAWGTRELAEEMIRDDAPSVLGDERELDWLVRWMRISAGPGTTRAEWRNFAEWDIRHVLTAINVPTLVIQRTNWPSLPVEEGRYLASRIPDARLVELPGRDDPPFCGDTDALLAEVESFVTGERRPHEADRVLATILFTDIVDSTRNAAELGDSRWKDVVAEHDERTREELLRFRGREVDTAGDGFLATFDGPARAVRCAQEISAAVADLGLQVRAGLHTGEIELAGDKVRGIAVHISSRVAALAGPGEVLVSSTVKDLVAGSGLVFEDAGEHELKGVPNRWRLYRVLTDPR
jgi:class 3 adenylate cyclase